MSIILGLFCGAFGGVLVLSQLAPFLGWFELILGCGLLVYGAVRNWERVRCLSKEFFGLAIAIVFFVLSVSVARYGRPYSFDFTSQRKFSLTESTKQVIRNLSNTMTLYFLPLGEITKIEEERALLNRYLQLGEKLQIIEVDPVKDIAIIERYSMKGGDRLILVDADGEDIHLSTIDERSLTTAFQTLSKQRVIQLHHVIGHGEAELRSSGPLGLSRMQEFLEGQGAVIHETELTTLPLNPQESPLLLLVAPQKPLSEEEESILERHFESGGSMLIALDDASLLPRVLAQAGFARSSEPVVRMVRSGAEGENHFSHELSVTIFKSHPVTSFLRDEASVLLSSAYMLHLSPPSNSRVRNQTPILFVRSSKNIGEVPGQHVLAAIAEHDSGGRLMVIGDSSWLRNHLAERAFNKEFLKGLIFWGSRVDVVGRALEEKAIGIDSAQLRSGSRSALFGFLLIIQLFVLLWIIAVFGRSQSHA